MTRDWTAMIAGERMELDGEFAERVEASSISSQQWSLVMTATKFEIENPDSPDEATIVANTDNLSAVASEMSRMGQEGFGDSTEGDRGGSIIRRIADKFSRQTTSSVDMGEAERLADEYAEKLQDKLLANGRWEHACAAAAGDDGERDS